MADHTFLKGEFIAAAALDRGVLVALDGSGDIVAADADSATASITKATGTSRNTTTPKIITGVRAETMSCGRYWPK